VTLHSTSKTWTGFRPGGRRWRQSAAGGGSFWGDRYGILKDLSGTAGPSPPHRGSVSRDLKERRNVGEREGARMTTIGSFSPATRAGRELAGAARLLLRDPTRAIEKLDARQADWIRIRAGYRARMCAASQSSRREIGFFRGRAARPQRSPEGSGKVHRYVPLRTTRI